MTERETYRMFSDAYADWDNIPSYYNASMVLHWALKLAAISDDYQAQLDEAHDIMDAAIG